MSPEIIQVKTKLVVVSIDIIVLRSARF